MFGTKETNISSVDDTYGFEKTLILLTKQGKVFAVSSLTGKILWKFFKPSEPIKQVFVEQNGGSDSFVHVMMISGQNLFLVDPITASVTSTKPHGASLKSHKFIMVKSENQGEVEHVLIAVPIDDSSNVIALGPLKGS